jgi:hypothetical protein
MRLGVPRTSCYCPRVFKQDVGKRFHVESTKNISQITQRKSCIERFMSTREENTKIDTKQMGCDIWT